MASANRQKRSEETCRSFVACGISNMLNGSEDCELHDQLSTGSVDAVQLEDRRPLQAKCMDMIFASDSEESFYGFESDE